MPVLAAPGITRRQIAAGVLAGAAPARAFPQARAAPGEGPGRGPWRTATPESKGLEPGRLDAMAAAIAPQQGRQGLVVVRDGVIVYERYWANDYHPARPDWRNVSFSSAKSWGAAMVGVAVRQGRLRVDDPILPHHGPERFGFRPETTVRHLLNMTSGGTLWRKPSSRRPAQLGEAREPRPGGDYIMASDEQPRSDGSWPPDGYGRPLPPGVAFWYSGADCDHLADVIAGAVGRPSLDYITEELFRPIGGEHIGYQPEGVDPRRNIRVGGSMELSVRDLARLGQLWLNRGRWGGQQLVDGAFVDQAITGSPQNPNYGFLWWLNTSGRLPGPRRLAYAYGAFGQMAYVLPDERIVVATMGYAPGPNHFDTDARLWSAIAPHIL